MKRMRSHPGQLLLAELEAREMSANRLALDDKTVAKAARWLRRMRSER